VTRFRRSALLVPALALVCAAAAAAQTATPAKTIPREEARERNMRAYVELLRSDLRTVKVAAITELMQFNEAEDKAFWPIYREYEGELARLNDDRIALIETYANTYDKLTPAVASDLVVKSLDLESKRTALKQKYFAKLKSAVSPLTAARAVQIEHQIQLLVDLQVAASLPVLQ
jgi:hypothetical protein